MKIDKALKKQKKYNKIFFASMIFLAIFLPLLTYLAYVDSLIILLFLALIELLIFIAILVKINNCSLRFTCINNKLKFKGGVFSNYNLIQCDKVAIVHTNKSNEDMEIIIITKVKSKNKKSRLINKDFMKRYKEAADEYLRLKKINDEAIYYFQVIRQGELNKYILLDNIYRNCVNATYTASAIDNIKIARGQKEF